jgi:pimeloyl-ACP methyl ester carboxylesterase
MPNHKEQSVQLAKGVYVVYELFGDGEGVPLVLTPGGAGGRGAFRWLAQRLARETGRRCLVHDRVNTGSSSLTLGEDAHQPEFDLQADFTHLLLHKLGLVPAILLGKSNGSRMSLVLAAKYPRDVSALILLNVTNGPKAAKKLSKDRYFKMLVRNFRRESTVLVFNTSVWHSL